MPTNDQQKGRINVRYHDYDPAEDEVVKEVTRTIPINDLADKVARYPDVASALQTVSTLIGKMQSLQEIGREQRIQQRIVDDPNSTTQQVTDAQAELTTLAADPGGGGA